MSQLSQKLLALGACIVPWIVGTDLKAALHQSKAGETKNLVQSERRLVRLGAASTMEQHSDQHFTLKSGTALVDNRKKFGSRAVKVSLENHQVSVGEGTCMVEYQEGGYVKVVCISGKVLLKTTALLGEFVELKAGQMAIFSPMEPSLPLPVEINLERFIHTTRLLQRDARELPNEKNLSSATAKQNAQFEKGRSTKTALVIHGKGTEVRMDGDQPKKGKPAQATASGEDSSSSKSDTKLAGTLATYVAVQNAMASTLNMTSFHMALSGAQELLGIMPVQKVQQVVNLTPTPPVMDPDPTPPVNPPKPPTRPPSGDGSGSGGRPPTLDPVRGYWEVNSNTQFSSTGLITKMKDGASLQLPYHSESPSDRNKIAQSLSFVGTNDFSAFGPVVTFYSDHETRGITFGHRNGRSDTVYHYGLGSSAFVEGASLSLVANQDVNLYHTELRLGHGTDGHLGVYSVEEKVVFYEALVEASSLSIQAPIVRLENSNLLSHSDYSGKIEITGIDTISRGDSISGYQTDLEIANTKIGVDGSPDNLEITANTRRLFIKDSSQLRALAMMTLKTQNSGDLRVEDSSAIVSTIGGELLMESAGDIHLHNVTMQADVIKASAMRANGWLHIQASQFNASDLIQFFANDSTGRISFDGGTTTLTSPVTHMKAATIEVLSGSSVNISGDAYLEAQSHLYNTPGKGAINAGQLHQDVAPPSPH